MLNIMDYSSTKSYIESVISTVDFSTVKYNKESDIDFNQFNFSELPEVDYTEADNRMMYVVSLLDKVSTSLGSSRLSTDKKENIKKAISYITNDIANYRQLPTITYIKQDRWDTLYTIKSRIADLGTKAPLALRDDLNHLSKLLSSDLNKINKNLSIRNHFFRLFAKELLNKCSQYYTEQYKKEIENKKITLDEIKSIKDDEMLSAYINKVNNQFGSGASHLLLAILHTKENEIPRVEFTWNEKIKGIIDFAKSLGLKEIAFEGESTSALGNLNIITKMGLSFKIIEIERKDFWSKSLIPVAVVSL